MGRCRMLTRASTGGLVVWAEAGASPQFALTRDQAEQLLEEVAGWEQALKAHYQQLFAGEDLRMACEAASSVRMLS